MKLLIATLQLLVVTVHAQLQVAPIVSTYPTGYVNLVTGQVSYTAIAIPNPTPPLQLTPAMQELLKTLQHDKLQQIK